MHSILYKTRIITIGVLLLSSVSCKKFLASYSQNNSFIETVSDLEEVLIGEVYLGRTNGSFISSGLFSMDDDVSIGIPKITVPLTLNLGLYYWQDNPYINTEGQLVPTDAFFNSMYAKIARANAVIANVEVLRDKGEPGSLLNKIAGEAFFLRAFYHFFLVNLYGKPYKLSTAESDFGIPLQIAPTIKDQFVSRSNIKQVYSQLLSDLLTAEKLLQGVNESSRIRVNQATVYALLSRIYLFMEQYEQAIYYADKVIANNHYQLIDYNLHESGKNVFNRNLSEVIFTSGSNEVYKQLGISQDEASSLHYIPSDELLGLYEDDDLRKNTFFIKNSKGISKFGKHQINAVSIDDVSDFAVIRFSEMFLNKAEALSQLDRFDEAKSTLQQCRLNKFKPDKLPPLHVEGAALIDFIRDERRRELCMEGHRWFDLRRYAVNTRYPFSKRIIHRSILFSGTAYIVNGYYKLDTYEKEPGAYIVPIANDEIEFNQGLLFNEPRPHRPLIQ